MTELEHHADLIPWQELAARTGATLRVIPVDDRGALRMEEAARVIGPATRIVAFSHVSNVLGAVNPVDELVALAHDVGALTVLDACQSVPHLPLDVKALGVDFAAFSGPQDARPDGHRRALGRRELLNPLPPFRTGGSMITTVRWRGPSSCPPRSASRRARSPSRRSSPWPRRCATCTPSACPGSRARRALAQRLV